MNKNSEQQTKDKSNSPTVVRLRRKNGEVAQDCDVYIGRQIYMGGWRLSRSKWANPFTVKEYGSSDEVIRRYREFLLQNTELLEALKNGELQGKVLGCWCKPGPCHGDVLVEESVRLSKQK